MISKTTGQRENLIEAINTLPDEMLNEVASFIEYLS